MEAYEIYEYIPAYRRESLAAGSHVTGSDLERHSYHGRSYQTGCSYLVPVCCVGRIKEMGSKDLGYQRKTKLWDSFNSLTYLFPIELGGNQKILSCFVSSLGESAIYELIIM